MPSIDFVARSTVIPATWLDDVNDAIFGPQSSAPAGSTAPTGVVGRSLNSIAALRSHSKLGPNTVTVLGYYTPGDQGGGDYYYDSSDTTSVDNGGSTIVATDSGRWKLTRTSSMTPQQFGALGDGTAGQDAFIQQLFDALPSGGTAWFSGVFNFTSLNFSTYRGKIKGDGLLYGTINITSPGTVGQSSYFEVEGLTWAPPAQDNTVDCIVLKNLAYGSIRGNKFRGVRRSISIPWNAAQSYFQDVNRVIVEGNEYDFVTNFIYSDYSAVDANYGVGDLTVSENVGMALLRHIDMQKADGITIAKNSFIFQLLTTDKREAIQVATGAYVTISDNKLFESGADDIKLTDVSFVTIVGNQHAYPGQVIDGAAINVSYPAGIPASNSMTITGNVIQRPSTGGIKLGVNCRNATVVGNQINQAGSNDHAQVGPTQLKEAVVEDSSCVDCSIYANNAINCVYNLSDGTRNVSRGNYYQSVAGNIGIVFDRMRVVDAGAATTPTVEDKDELVYSQSVSIVGFTNSAAGSVYRLIQVRFTVGTCLVVHGANLVLKGAVDASPPANSIMTFRVPESGASIEVSRSF